jgi:hypothetical protein
LSGGVNQQEAEALSIEQEFDYWFNTPNPCVKQQLERDHSWWAADIISDASLLNYVQWFGNTAPGGAAGGWVGGGIGFGAKVGIVYVMNRLSGAAGAWATRLF